MGYNNVAEQWVNDEYQSRALFIDLAEETHPDSEIRLSDLIGKLPVIAHYAPKTQAEILRATTKKMADPAWPGDKLRRIRGGVYVWECRDWRNEGVQQSKSPTAGE